MLLDYVNRAFSRAKYLGVKKVVFGSSGARSVPEGFDKKKTYEQIVFFINAIVPIAKQYGIIIVLEPLCENECNIINTVAEGLELVKQINHENFKLLADFYHMAVQNEDFGIIKDSIKYLHHVHIASFDRIEPTPDNKGEFAKIFGVLRAAGYDGTVSVESKDEHTKTGLEILQSMK